MSDIKKRKKAKKPTKRFDASAMRKVLEDQGFSRGFFTCLGIVQAAEDGGVHFDLDDEDLTVDVLLMPSEELITVRLGSAAAGPGWGIWAVPPVGAEVMIAIPDGDTNFQPMIASFYSSGQLPPGLNATTIVISAPPGGDVLIHDGDGNTDRLVKESAYKTHKHPSGMGPTGVADNSLDPASYTEVLGAK